MNKSQGKYGDIDAALAKKILETLTIEFGVEIKILKANRKEMALFLQKNGMTWDEAFKYVDCFIYYGHLHWNARQKGYFCHEKNHTDAPYSHPVPIDGGDIY